MRTNQETTNLRVPKGAPERKGSSASSRPGIVRGFMAGESNQFCFCVSCGAYHSYLPLLGLVLCQPCAIWWEKRFPGVTLKGVSNFEGRVR